MEDNHEPKELDKKDRKELEAFNRTVAKKFGGYAYSGWRPPVAEGYNDPTPFSKILVNGSYGEFENMGEPADAIFVPTAKLKTCLQYIDENKPPVVKGLKVVEK